MKKITVGVIGAGRIGKLHIENILQYFPWVKIKSVADPLLDQDYIQHKAIDVFTCDAAEVIADGEINAVIICSPTPMHAAQIIACAKAGKHIFCEKPIAMSLAEIEKCLLAVNEATVKLQIGFNRRFDPNFAKIKSMLSSNEIGFPHLLKITSRDPEIPSADYIKSSSGMFLDMTIHDFDMARFLMNSEINEVYASGNVLIDPVFKEYDDVDTAVINLKFANGCLGVIDNSRKAIYGYDQRVEVFGSAGAIHADNNRSTNTTLTTTQGVMTEKPLRFFLERYKESYLAELRSFFECIANDSKPSVSGIDGLMSVVIGLAAQKSLKENRPIAIEHLKWSEMT